MPSAKDIRTIIGILGTIVSSLISLSQIPSFIKIYNRKSVEDDDEPHPHVHLSMIIECVFWVLYGLPLVQKDNIIVTISSGVGLLMEVIYFVLFIIYCKRDKVFYSFKDQDEESPKWNIVCILVTELVAVALIFGGGCLRGLTGSLSDRRVLLIGFLCFMFTWVTLLKKLYYVSPNGLSLAGFVNAGIWIIYSLVYQIDFYLLVCNVLRALFYAGRLIVNSRNNKSHGAVVPVNPRIPDEQILQD